MNQPSEPPRPPGEAPTYPGQEPAYPGDEPVYPGDEPAYPGDEPAYPRSGHGPPPEYPAGEPAHPGCALPQEPPAPPAYPAPGTRTPPPPPPASPPAPSGPTPSVPPQVQPFAGSAPGGSGTAAARAPHEHDLELQGGRRLVNKRQRRTDFGAWSRLIIQLPTFGISLVLVSMIAWLFFGSLDWLVVLVWIGSGALIFHRPTESLLARRLLRLRHPTPEERAALEPVWDEVTRRAGVRADTYELWIDGRDTVNAMAAAGHIVGVTERSLHTLPSGQLAAVLAHELGHHTGGHAWAALLGQWYGLPALVAWTAVRAVTSGLMRGARAKPVLSGCLLFGFGGCGFLFLLLSAWVLLLPMAVAPLALAWSSRRAELRADEHAAKLGFAPMLAEVLTQEYAREQAAAAAPPAPQTPPAPPAYGPHPPQPPYGRPGPPPQPGPYGHPGPHPQPGPYGSHPGPYPHPGPYGQPVPYGSPGSPPYPGPHGHPGPYGHPGGPGTAGPKPPAQEGGLARLLSTHPDHPTRLRHLQPYLSESFG